jgi:Uma2 family endonuclease
MTITPARRIHSYSYEAYLEHESSSNSKHEFLDGEIYAMAGGTIEHAVLSVNVSAALSTQLRGAPGLVASSDPKVRVLATGLASYPDVTVICGQPERDALSRDVVLNPTVVVEALSDSTEEWDRGEKLEHYKKIPSLRECVLVSHRRRLVEVCRRGDDGAWTTLSGRTGEVLLLQSLGCQLQVDEIYRNVDLPD